MKDHVKHRFDFIGIIYFNIFMNNETEPFGEHKQLKYDE